MIDKKHLEDAIAASLLDFYQRRLDRLTGLQLRDALSKKNPYLFRATGVTKASEIVEGLLRPFVSSSDEGIFGGAFFEPIACLVSGGTVSPSEGVDVAVVDDTTYKAVSVKSGPSIFNASQAKKMNQEFLELRSRVYKMHKQFDALLGHGYGRKAGEPSHRRIYRIRSGQAFWQELTGDPDFYLSLIELMGDLPQKQRPAYAIEWDKAVNRFTKEFLDTFATSDGGIDWAKLASFNSGAGRRPRKGRSPAL